jgi:uncharacterized repeat protein (TIGR03803 family)
MRSKPRSAAKGIFAILITLLLASIVVPAQTQQATKFTVLHTFKGSDGALPDGQLTRDAAGNLYGTTSEGGTEVCGNYGCGTAFKLDKNGKQVWLHSFNGKNGRQPMAGLLRDAAGNLYGTTVEGGDTTCFSLGCGTVFELDKTGKETVLHKFSGNPDGEMPESLLVENAGNLYGTTYLGGASGGYGTVFKLDAESKETILHSFAGLPDGGGDGAYSYDGVIRDTAGNLYGVTFDGGAYGAGVVYKLDSAGKETLLYSFAGGSDGANPDSVLLLDSQGRLYGTTANGGNSECGGTGCGVVFELSPHTDGSWSETVFYTFCSVSNCADGEEPDTGPLALDAAGNLYGTTYFGGANGDGVVFELDVAGQETVLHSFTGGADGAGPVGVIIDRTGSLYGTAELGGDTKCAVDKQGCGVVFKLTP